MKARVKATGTIVNVELCRGKYVTRENQWYSKEQLIFSFEEDFGYWEKLKHQYAGMAMQSYINNNVYMREIREMCKIPNEMREMVADLSVLLATALVEKLKNE